jgi:DNA-binding transcriptional ArsR family regulator
MSSSLRPNFTQLPNICLDWLLPLLDRSEMLCLLYVLRRTYGFGRQADAIKLEQFTTGLKRRDGTPLDRGTGILRRQVCRALSVLERAGIIIRTRKQSEDGSPDTTIYRINTEANFPESWEAADLLAQQLTQLRSCTSMTLPGVVQDTTPSVVHGTTPSVVQDTTPSVIHDTTLLPISSGKKDSGKKDGKERVFDSENAPTGEDSSSEKSPATKRPPARPTAKKPGELSDTDWLAMLKARPAYKMFDVSREYDKMLLWCESKGQQPTRQRFLNWLNRQDKPLTTPAFGGERQRRPDPVADSILRTIKAQEEAKGNHAQSIREE